MNDHPSATEGQAKEAETLARQRRIGWAMRLWELAVLFLIGTVTTIDFPPYVVWKLPAPARIVLAMATLIVAFGAALASKAPKR